MHPILAGIVEAQAGDFLIAVVAAFLGPRRADIVEIGPGMLVERIEAQVRRDIILIFDARRPKIITARAIGGAGLHHVIGTIAVRLAAIGPDHEAMLADRAANIAIQASAGKAVEAGIDLAAQIIAEVAGDDIDDTGRRLGVVEQAFAAFQHLDPLDHAGGHGVVGRGAAIEAVVEADAVHRPQHILGARTLQRNVDIAERPGLRPDEQARHRFERTGGVDRGGIAGLRVGDDLDGMAIARQLLRQRLFQAGAGDDDAVAFFLSESGRGKGKRKGQGGP